MKIGSLKGIFCSVCTYRIERRRIRAQTQRVHCLATCFFFLQKELLFIRGNGVINVLTLFQFCMNA